MVYRLPSWPCKASGTEKGLNKYWHTQYGKAELHLPAAAAAADRTVSRSTSKGDGWLSAASVPEDGACVQQAPS